METAAPPSTIVFLSDKDAFRMIRHSQGVKYMPNGDWYADPADREVDYQFRAGRLEVEPGQDMLMDGVDLETGDVVPQDAAAYIRAHPDFGSRVVEAAVVAPDSGPILSKIALAAAKRDTNRLIELGNEEAAGWARREVLYTIREALASLEKGNGS